MMKRWLRRLHPRTRLAQGVLIVAVAMASALGGALSVQAITDTLPDDGSDHFLIISRYGNGVYLQAPVTYAKLVYPRNADTVRIFDGPYCGKNHGGKYDTATPDPGSCKNPPAALRVIFEFQTLDASGNLVGPVKKVLADDMTTNGWYNVDLRGLADVAPDDQGNHLVRMKAYWEDASPNGRYDGGINAFKVDLNGSGSYVTYASQDSDTYPLAVMQRPSDLSAPYKHSDFEFQFAPDCDMQASTVRKDLKWYDADFGSFNQSGSIGWKLYDETSKTTVASLSNSKLGGGNSTKTYAVTFSKGHKYTWTWTHVDSRNGVQLWLPFDSYNYVKKCFAMKADIVAPNGMVQPPGPLPANGTTYTLSPQMHNDGPQDSANEVISVDVPACAQFVSANNGGAHTGGAGGYGGKITWPGRPVAKGADWKGDLFSFKVNPACDGQKLTFLEHVTPGGSAGGEVTDSITYNVESPHYPAIVGLSGDVHAGGGLCGQAASGGGAILGQASSSSVGEYVVSARGSVGGFGSNNAPGGSAATLGLNGNYYSVCRPDLVGTAKAYMNANPGAFKFLNQEPGFPNVNVGPLSGVYFVNGGPGPVKLRGTFSNKVTIVVLTGNVEIDGNIILNAPSKLGSDAPSMGIIAANDILVHGAATRVDAYLFSDGTINTCAEGNTPACQNTLAVNGFLMAHGLSFRRLGPKVSGNAATVGEQINLTGQIYLNPPVLFDNAGSVNLLQNLGEKPPLN